MGNITYQCVLSMHGQKNQVTDECTVSVCNIICTQVKHDFLDLRVPVWVTEIGFTPASGAQPTVAVGTGYHQV